jgi:hypothetical protein
MEITEKDIFYYIFYPSELEEDKLRYIDESKDRFPQMSVYREINDSLNREVSPAVKNKLAKKIPAYKLPVVYELFPWTIEAAELDKNNPVLAAATVEVPSENLSKTFIDKEKNIIIRLIGTNSRSRLYVFPVSGNKLGEFALTLNPGRQKYYFRDSLESRIIEDVPEVHSISIEVYPE